MMKGLWWMPVLMLVAVLCVPAGASAQVTLPCTRVDTNDMRASVGAWIQHPYMGTGRWVTSASVSAVCGSSFVSAIFDGWGWSVYGELRKSAGIEYVFDYLLCLNNLYVCDEATEEGDLHTHPLGAVCSSLCRSRPTSGSSTRGTSALVSSERRGGRSPQCLIPARPLPQNCPVEGVAQGELLLRSRDNWPTKKTRRRPAAACLLSW